MNQMEFAFRFFEINQNTKFIFLIFQASEKMKIKK